MKKKLFSILWATLLLSSCMSADDTAPYNPPTPIINHSPTIFDIEIETSLSSQRLNDKRPNIIFILTDDQPYHTVDYMPFVKTELMAKGVVFENGFVTTPLCCPSRASLLSGQYAHNHQVLNNTMPMGGAPKYNDEDSVSIWLQDAGYRTAYFGKYMNGYEDIEPRGYVPPGWNEWKVFLGKNLNHNEDSGNLQYFYDFSMSENGIEIEYPRSAKNFSADVVTRTALEFIRDSSNEPFFMTVSYYNPHSPYVTAPRHRNSFRASEDDYWDWIPYRPPSFNEQDIRDKPDYIGALSPLSSTELDTAHKQILRSLLSVDDGVASIVTALKKANLYENTIIVFMSDNGLTIGDHRFGASKNCPYEACIKVPFIVYAPAYYQARVDSSIVANIDIAPTFAELGDAIIPENVDGVSMVSLLLNPEATWRDEILIEHWPTDGGVGSMIPEFYSIRTLEWKYTEYVTGEVELYDLVNDPHELRNIEGKKEYREIQTDLAAKLQELKKQ